MKMLCIAVLAGLVTTTGFAQNTNNAAQTTSNQTSATSDTIAPANVQGTFSTRYPNATNVRWYRYSPPSAVEPGEWYSTLGPDDYYVSFTADDENHIAWYDNGNWIHSTTTIDDTELPEAVRSAINREYPGFVVTDVDREHDARQLLYEVKLQKGNQRWNVHYKPDGSVFKKKQRDLKSTTPATGMTSDFQTRYPGATDVSWSSYDASDRMETLPDEWNANLDENDHQVIYTLDGGQYVAYYDNGQWIHAESLTFDHKKLPAAVNNALTSQYAGYTIKDVSREDSRNQVLYEVELTKGTDKCKIHFTADGSVAKKKCKTDGVKTKSKS